MTLSQIKIYTGVFGSISLFWEYEGIYLLNVKSKTEECTLHTVHKFTEAHISASGDVIVGGKDVPLCRVKNNKIELLSKTETRIYSDQVSECLVRRNFGTASLFSNGELVKIPLLTGCVGPVLFVQDFVYTTGFLSDGRMVVVKIDPRDALVVGTIYVDEYIPAPKNIWAQRYGCVWRVDKLLFVNANSELPVPTHESFMEIRGDGDHFKVVRTGTEWFSWGDTLKDQRLE